MAATKSAFKAPGKQGDRIFGALVKLSALIVLLLMGGIIVSPDLLFLAKHTEIWFRVFVDQNLGRS